MPAQSPEKTMLDRIRARAGNRAETDTSPVQMPKGKGKKATVAARTGVTAGKKNSEPGQEKAAAVLVRNDMTALEFMMLEDEVQKDIATANPEMFRKLMEEAKVIRRLAERTTSAKKTMPEAKPAKPQVGVLLFDDSDESNDETTTTPVTLEDKEALIQLYRIDMQGNQDYEPSAALAESMKKNNSSTTKAVGAANSGAARRLIITHRLMMWRPEKYKNLVRYVRDGWGRRMGPAEHPLMRRELDLFHNPDETVSEGREKVESFFKDPTEAKRAPLRESVANAWLCEVCSLFIVIHLGNNNVSIAEYRYALRAGETYLSDFCLEQLQRSVAMRPPLSMLNPVLTTDGDGYINMRETRSDYAPALAHGNSLSYAMTSHMRSPLSEVSSPTYHRSVSQVHSVAPSREPDSFRRNLYQGPAVNTMRTQTAGVPAGSGHRPAGPPGVKHQLQMLVQAGLLSEQVHQDILNRCWACCAPAPGGGAAGPHPENYYDVQHHGQGGFLLASGKKERK
jgi:hypothetical protein